MLKPVLTLNNSVHGTTLLTKPTINALGHVDIVSGRPSRPVFSLLCFNRDGLRGTDGFAELASDASFFARRVPTEGVFATEARRNRTFLEGVVDRISGHGKSAYGENTRAVDWRVMEGRTVV